jgi:hypothetical protein
MAVSTLHHHFQVLTAAFEAGYESASQFNREYSRFLANHRSAIFGVFARQALRDWSWSAARWKTKCEGARPTLAYNSLFHA